MLEIAHEVASLAVELRVGERGRGLVAGHPDQHAQSLERQVRMGGSNRNDALVAADAKRHHDQVGRGRAQRILEVHGAARAQEAGERSELALDESQRLRV